MSYGRVVHAHDAGVRRLHGPRALGAGHDRAPRARRRAAPAGAADVRARPAPRDGARSARNGADDAGTDGVPRPRTRRSGRRAELLARLAGRLCRALPRTRPTADWRWFEPDADLRQRAPAAGAVARVRAHAGDPESREVAREALEFLEATCFRGRSPGPGRATRAGTRAAGRGRCRRAADRRGGVRARLPRRVPRDAATTATCGACARRSPGSWAPTAWAPPVYDSATAGCRDGLGEQRAESEPGRREHRLVPAVAHRDAGARRRRPRVRPGTEARA